MIPLDRCERIRSRCRALLERGAPPEVIAEVEGELAFLEAQVRKLREVDRLSNEAHTLIDAAELCPESAEPLKRRALERLLEGREMAVDVGVSLEGRKA